jgi:hypothetical protein
MKSELFVCKIDKLLSPQHLMRNHTREERSDSVSESAVEGALLEAELIAVLRLLEELRGRNFGRDRELI